MLINTTLVETFKNKTMRDLYGISGQDKENRYKSEFTSEDGSRKCTISEEAEGDIRPKVSRKNNTCTWSSQLYMQFWEMCPNLGRLVRVQEAGLLNIERAVESAKLYVETGEFISTSRKKYVKQQTGQP